MRPPHNGTATSKTAAIAIAGVAESLREQVFNLIVSSGRAGMTCDEINETTGILVATITPRLNELERKKRIFRPGTTRPTRSERPAFVWVASEARQ